MRKIFVFVLAMFFVIPAFASQEAVDNLIQKIEDQKLYEDPYWAVLLHYKKLNFGTYKSTIADKTFFLSKDGKYDLKAEMIATVKSFFGPEVKEEEVERKFKHNYSSKYIKQHGQCAYPARFKWLDSKLNISKYVKKQKCPAFKKWFDDMDGKSATVVFASSYINNPASMFGHTFLRIDKDTNNVYNSPTINYAAITSEKPTALGFALNGIFGGYPGIYTFNPYYEKIKNYGVTENRDLVEYNLNYNSEEIDFLLKHMWELSYTYSDYYFFNHNCSSVLIDLVDVGRGSVDLNDDFGYFILPINTLKSAVRHDIVKDINFRPSTQNKIKNRYKQLTSDERRAAHALNFKKLDLVDAAEYNKLSDQSKANVLDIVYDMQQYMLVTKRIDIHSMRFNSFVILKEKKDLGINSNFDDSALFERIDYGHNINTLSLEAGYSDIRDSYVSFSLMPLYHQLMDDDYGFVKFSEIKVLEAKITYLLEQQKFYLDKFTFFSLASLVSNEAFFRSWSWKLGLDYEKFEDFKRWNINKDVFNATGSFGKSYNTLGQNLYLLLNGGVMFGFNQELFEQDVLGKLGINIGSAYKYKKIKNIFDLKFDTYSDPAYNNYSVSNSFGYNWNKNNRIQLNLKFQGLYNIGKVNREISISYLAHF